MNGRATAGSIYFLPEKDDVSHFHRLDCDEIWYYHAGCDIRRKCPAVLVETAFIDNAQDAELLRDKQDDFARAIARRNAGFFFKIDGTN